MMKSSFKNTTILIVEDDILALKYLVKILGEHFLNVMTALNGLEAFEKFMTNKIDIILTDIRMPVQNGIDFVEKIRMQNVAIPIVYMSAYAEVDVLMQTMKHSANGFLLKPIKVPELFQYLNDGISKSKQLKLVQNTSSSIDDECNIVGGAIVNLKLQTVMLGNEEVFLSKKELQLLELFLANHQAILSREMIEEYLWFGNTISDSSVKVLMNKLRDKLGKDSIATVKNIGYKINLLTI